jgi:hypothetical protein
MEEGRHDALLQDSFDEELLNWRLSSMDFTSPNKVNT